MQSGAGPFNVAFTLPVVDTPTTFYAQVVAVVDGVPLATSAVTQFTVSPACGTAGYNDPANCGACGVVCGPGQVCSNSACVTPVALSAASEGYGCGSLGPPILSNEGLTMTGQGYGWVRSTTGVSAGKRYLEVTVNPNTGGLDGVSFGMLGVSFSSVSSMSCYPGYSDPNSDGWELGTGVLYGAQRTAGWSTQAVPGDIIGVYLDADDHTVGFAKNCTFIGTAFSGVTGPLFPVLADSWPDNYNQCYGGTCYRGGNAVLTANFAGPYHCPIPAGYSGF